MVWKCLKTLYDTIGAEEVDAKLHAIMVDIHTSCVAYGSDGNGYTNYVKGANIAGFVKVADAMLDQGVV